MPIATPRRRKRVRIAPMQAALKNARIRIVQSRQNARVKELRAALRKGEKTSAGLVAIEGIHLVEEALRSGLRLSAVFVRSGSLNLLNQLQISNGVEILELPADLFESAVTTESPQGIAALVEAPVFALENILASPRPLIVVSAGLQDPGNLGTIIRSAEAFGANCVISLPGTVSQWNPKAMRASAGSVFRLPVLAAAADECFDRLHTTRIQTIAAMAHDATPLEQHNLALPTAFVIGSEGSGLSPEIAARCDGRVTIPCPGPVESLNAAVAASILLYEASRKRGASR